MMRPSYPPILGQFFKFTVIVCILFAAGCAPSIRNLPVNRGEPCPIVGEANRTKLHVQYLGTGGYLFRYGTNELLTAPYFSNHALYELFFPVFTKRGLVDRLIPNLDNVDTILVGHAHHDHLMDIPYILKSTGTQAKVYGSKTTVNLLANRVEHKGRLVEVESGAGTFDGCREEGQWTTNSAGTIRFMPLKSMHAPQIGNVVIGHGHACAPQPNRWLHFWKWKEGQTLAFIIDFLKDDGSIAFRVVYQDSGVDGEKFGILPDFKNRDDARTPDLAILCLASFHHVDGYPAHYLQHLKPKDILIGHWEDFFRSPVKRLKAVRITPAEKFMDALPCPYRCCSSTLPAPGGCFHFDIR